MITDGAFESKFAENVLLLSALPLGMLDAIEEVGRLPDYERRYWYDRWLRTIVERGDVLMYGGKGCAEAFGALCRGLAVLAHEPGGVAFAGLHWCVGSGHRATREKAPCDAEVAREQREMADNARCTNASCRKYLAADSPSPYWCSDYCHRQWLASTQRAQAASHAEGDECRG